MAQRVEELSEAVALRCAVVGAAGGGEGERQELQERRAAEVAGKLERVLEWAGATQDGGAADGEGDSSGSQERGAAAGGSGAGRPLALGLGLTCGTCGKVFESLEAQRGHFATDLHRLNVKRSVAGKPALTEDVFEAILIAGDELSSISGSDSEAEDEAGGPGPQRRAANESGKGAGFMVTFRPEGEGEAGDREAFAIPRGVLFPLFTKGGLAGAAAEEHTDPNLTDSVLFSCGPHVGGELAIRR